MGWPANTVRVLMNANAQTITGVGTASATVSAAFPAGAVAIRIVSNGAIWFNTAGSASSAAGAYLPANTVEYVACGGSSVISLIAVTTNANTAWITPCSA